MSQAKIYSRDVMTLKFVFAHPLSMILVVIFVQKHNTFWGLIPFPLGRRQRVRPLIKLRNFFHLFIHLSCQLMLIGSFQRFVHASIKLLQVNLGQIHFCFLATSFQSFHINLSNHSIIFFFLPIMITKVKKISGVYQQGVITILVLTLAFVGFSVHFKLVC